MAAVVDAHAAGPAAAIAFLRTWVQVADARDVVFAQRCAHRVVVGVHHARRLELGGFGAIGCAIRTAVFARVIQSEGVTELMRQDRGQ